MLYNAVKLTIVLVCTLYTFVVLAEKKSFFSAGDAAFAAGDYKIACELYKDNIGKIKSPADSQARLKYIIALIESGQIDNARKAFDDFKKKYPNNDSQLIEGKLFLAEGRDDEAKEFFTKKINSKDQELSTLAKYNLAEIEKKLNNKPAAALLYEQITQSKAAPLKLKYQARLNQIHLEIDNKNISKAKQLILATPKEKYFQKSLEFTILSLLLETKENKLDNLSQEKWEKLATTPKAKESPCLNSLAFSAYEAYNQINKKTEALYFLTQAFKYALDDETRKAHLQNLTHYAIDIDIKKAATFAKKYYEFYPYEQAGFDLLMAVASSMTKKNLNQEAIELFKLVINNDNYSLTGRREAAEQAANAGKVAKDYQTCHYMYKFLIDKSLNASSRQEREINYGEFLLSINQDEEAEKYLTSAIAGDPEKSKIAYYNLLQLYLKQENLPSAKKIADTLRKSTDKKYALLGTYTAATIAQKTNSYQEAKELYWEFIKSCPDTQKVAQATFLAAVMDMYLGNLNESAKNLEKFAHENPKDENAPKALFMAIRSSTPIEAERRFNLLCKLFPNSPIIAISALQLSDILVENNKAQEAIQVLSANQKYAANEEEIAEFLYSKAKIYYNFQKNNDEALKLLNELTQYTKSNLINQANFMMGEINFNLGEYSQAVKFFNLSLKNNKDKASQQIFQGRIGDALLSLYKQKENKDDLKKATDIFINLASSAFPHIKIQSLYKLGECYKYHNENKEASKAWSKLIYTSIAMQKNNIAPNNFWCEKAITEYIKLKLVNKTPNAVKEAIHLLEQYETLDLPNTSNNIEELKKSLNEYYNFLKQ